MNSGTEVFEDHKSPSSAAEPLSGSNSPHIIRPTVLPPGLMHNRPRSSSINSNGSNHSNHTRSLSIASLESPRNSIVSIDDGFLRSTTRNNSTTSLNSVSMTPSSNLNNPGTPKHTPTSTPSFIRERFLFNNPKLKAAASSSAVLFSDDDDDTKIFRPKVSARSRSNSNGFQSSSSSSTQAVSSASGSLYASANTPAPAVVSGSSATVKPPPIGPVAPVAPKKGKKLMLKKDYRFKFNEVLKAKPFPDPRSLSTDSTPSPLSLTADDVIPNTTIEKNRENHKKKATVKQPGTKLKKNLIFSKDVRLELMGNSKPDFSSKFPQKDSSDDNGTKLPILHTLKQQSQLISKLNRKWNKADRLMAHCLGTSTDTEDDTAVYSTDDNDNDNDNSTMKLNVTNETNDLTASDSVITTKERLKRRYSSDTDS